MNYKARSHTLGNGCHGTTNLSAKPNRYITRLRCPLIYVVFKYAFTYVNYYTDVCQFLSLICLLMCMCVKSVSQSKKLIFKTHGQSRIHLQTMGNLIQLFLRSLIFMAVIPPMKSPLAKANLCSFWRCESQNHVLIATFVASHPKFRFALAKLV